MRDGAGGLLDLGINVRQVVAAVPRHCRAKLAREAGDDLARVARELNQRSWEGFAQGIEAVAQPPRGGPADAPAHRLVDVKPHDGAALGRPGQSGVISQAQVVAEPYNRRGTHRDRA